jgi:hypothetical protein
MSKIVVKGFMATTHPVSAYNQVLALPPEYIYSMVEAIRSGRLPLTFKHDARYQANLKLLLAEVRETDDGHLGMWVEFEAEEEEWEQHGFLSGFSVTVVGNIFEPDPTDTKPMLKIFADAGHFEDADYVSAVEHLQEHFAVGGGRIYQFSELPPVRVIIELVYNTLQSIPGNILASALYDGLKWLLRPKRVQREEPVPDTVFEFRIKNGNQSIDAQLKTSNDELLKEALTTFQSIALSNSQSSILEFDKKSHKWEKLR